MAGPTVICVINDDRLLDVVVGGPTKTAISVFINKTAGHGHAARIHPRKSGPNPYAIDAVISVYPAGDLNHKNAKPIHSAKAHWDGTPIHVGLGDRSQYDLRIVFPNGEKLELTKVESDKAVTASPEGTLVDKE